MRSLQSVHRQSVVARIFEMAVDGFLRSHRLFFRLA
jgi:hypothetical protein